MYSHPRVAGGFVMLVYKSGHERTQKHGNRTAVRRGNQRAVWKRGGGGRGCYCALSPPENEGAFQRGLR